MSEMLLRDHFSINFLHSFVHSSLALLKDHTKVLIKSHLVQQLLSEKHPFWCVYLLKKLKEEPEQHPDVQEEMLVKVLTL